MNHELTVEYPKKMYRRRRDVFALCTKSPREDLTVGGPAWLLHASLAEKVVLQVFERVSHVCTPDGRLVKARNVGGYLRRLELVSNAVRETTKTLHRHSEQVRIGPTIAD